MALAFSKHSSYSFSGSDNEVIALPTENERYDFSIIQNTSDNNIKIKLPFGAK